LDDAINSLSANSLSLEMRLSMPLWDAGRSTMEEDREQLAVRLHELELRDARTNIELEVRDALRQLDDAERRHQLFEASTRLAEETLRISEERFGRGLIDTDRYLLAQAEAASARLGRTEALLDLYRARARLRFVTLSGGL
jgi:outer membrane protein TolC